MCRDPGSIGRIGQAARAGRMVDALAILCPSANEIMNEGRLVAGMRPPMLIGSRQTGMG